MDENLFYNIITELVYREMRKRNQNYSNIASIINKSEEYVRKINSSSSTKRYNLEHLFLLSKEWKISIEDLVPNSTNIGLICKYSKLTSYEVEELLSSIKQSLKGDHE